jgi:hypothetical protein
MSEKSGFLTKYFGVVANEETYLNLMYLLLAFPLGVVYFTFLVTGLSLGLGTVIIWIGIPILLAVFAASWGLAAFERMLAMLLLREEIPPMSPVKHTSESAWEKVKAHLGNRVTWTGLLYLILKFPVATFFFVVAVTLLATTIGMLITPFLYQVWTFPSGWDFWRIDTLGESLFVAGLGLVLAGPISLHVVNFMAYLSGTFARAMLGKSEESRSSEAEVAVQT